MEKTLPHIYLKDLKEKVLQEKERIKEQKELFIKSNDYEIASLYRDIENKIIEFLQALNLKN